jgi:hypothetical protein
MAFGTSRFYRQGQNANRPEPLYYIKLPGVETNVWTDSSGNTHLRLHDTNVVSFNDRWITLRTGGWKTMMTKVRMNWASGNYNLGFRVDSEPSKKNREGRGVWTEGITGEERQVELAGPDDRSRRSSRFGTRHEGDWFVEYDGRYPFDEETVSLNRETHQMVEEDMVKPTDDLYGCKRQRHGFSSNPGRVSSRNIAMSGKVADKVADDIDVEVDDQGSIILFRLASEKAREWWDEHVQGAQKFGGRYAVEHRYAMPVVEGMMADGLNVSVR